MSRVAFFVDAGYLFAQGSTALTGEKRPRTEVKLNDAAALAELMGVAKARCDGIRLLRTYWYDAPPNSGLTSQHISLASTDHVKLRLGAINGQGQQKGVDSLIVTDMIELARNKSICDAVLLSGDEDVRIGVQIAQNYGVAVHLIGIHPARGSQSAALRQEADTNTEWDKETVAKFLTVSAPLRAPPPANDAAEAGAITPAAGEIDQVVARVIEEMISTFDSDALASFETYWASGANGLPSEVDRPYLGRMRDAAGRQLDRDELRKARRQLDSRIREMLKVR